MRYRNIENWKSPEKDRGLLFFAQRLDELTFSYTLDSYRAPTMSPPELAAELLEQISFTRSLGKPASALNHIIKEFESRLRSNPVISKILSINLTFYLAYDKESLDDIEQRVRVLEREISPRSYALKCFEFAEEICTTNRKAEIDFVAKEIVSTLNNYGVSSAHINQTVVDYFFRNTAIHGIESLKAFFREIFPHHHLFDICFISKSPISRLPEDVLSVLRIKSSKEITEKFERPKGAAKIRKLKASEIYLFVEGIRAADRFSAVELAKDRIQRMHDLFGIFHHKEGYVIDDMSFALQSCCDEELSTVKTHINRMQFTIDNTPEDAAKKLERLVEGLLLPMGTDGDKFFRAIGFHGSSSDAGSIETQIVNIWTAMESMIPSRPKSTIVSAVVSGILPFIGLNYFYRLFRTITLDLVRWDRRALQRALNKAKYHRDSDLIDKIFCLIVLPQNEDALSGLFTDMRNFELLRYRCYALRKTFESPKSACKFLERHTERVSWQLHRIYRARNAAVHSGEAPSNAGSLFSNAHDYFDQMLEISNAFCSGSSGYDNYRDAFKFASWSFEQYVSKLSKIDYFNDTNCGLVLWRPPAAPNASRWWNED